MKNNVLCQFVILLLFLFSCNKEAQKEAVIADENTPSLPSSSREYAVDLYAVAYNGDIYWLQNYIEDPDKHYYTLSEHINLFSNSDLRILRNMIYAMHGYRFRSIGLQEYFQQFTWYSGTKENVDNELSENEQEFVQVILAMEAAIALTQEANINPPRGIQGIWLLDKSYWPLEEIGWIDRGNEGIILRIDSDNIYVNGKSIEEDGNNKNAISFFTATGNDFLHGDYYEVVYSFGGFNQKTYRYYIPYTRDKTMRVEYYVNNLGEGVEYYNTVFGFNDAIIITDEINVRSSPSISGTNIQTKKFGDILQLYDQQGSGHFVLEEGILDLWYKISPDREEWVNALYVKKFPFYIAGEDSEYRTDNGDNAMYTSSIIVMVENAYEDSGAWFLNMDVYDLEDGFGGSYVKYSRAENIQESYFFNNKIVRLKENLFNNVVELYNDIQSKIYEIPIPSFVAWSWYHYDADGYDLSETELIYGIETGKPIDYVMGILGPFSFRENYDVFVYSQWGADIYGYQAFKIKFFTGGENRGIYRIIYERPFIK